MSGQFFTILISIAMCDVVLFWLCLEKHTEEMKAIHAKDYLVLDWSERFFVLCENDEHISTFAFFIPCLLFVGILEACVFPFAT